jgi:acetyl esterase/lipase
MIHGGGFVMLSRKDVRPKQTSMLLDKGFLPISIDYRLAPEVNILEGSMVDVCDAMQWARYTLPYLALKRPDVQISADDLVVVGWSTGGHLSMTSAWTSIDRGIEPPSAILAFYCPTDFEDECWYKANVPEGSQHAINQDYDLLEGVYDQPITSYNIPLDRGAIGGWLSPSDARSRIILHMNWTDQFVPILLTGLPSRSKTAEFVSTYWKTLPRPKATEVRSISPLAQIKAGKYQVPTFLIHTDADDLIPIEQAERTYRALKEQDISGCEFIILKGVPHLFDLYKKFEQGETGQAISRAYEWLGEKVGL